MDPRIHIITLGVADLSRAYEFYHHGLGFPTSGTPEDGIIFFKTDGVILELYPDKALAEDVSPDFPAERSRFSGITVAHVARSKEDVDAFLQQAVEAGGTLEKPAQIVFWGGYSGYFSDPDGYLWEVAYSDNWEFNPDGSLVLD